MSKSWRPEGWSVKEIYLESIGTSLTITGWDAKMIELGADAMLKALRDIGAPLNRWVYIGKKMAGRGKLVFIPNILDIEGK